MYVKNQLTNDVNVLFFLENRNFNITRKIKIIEVYYFRQKQATNR